MSQPIARPDAPPPPVRGAGDDPLRRRALRVLGSYAVFGVAWVLLSDRLLFAIAPDRAVLSTLGQWKGLAFILLSTLLLFLLMSRRLPGDDTGDDAAPDRLAGPEAEHRGGGPAAAWLWGTFAVTAAAIVVVGLVSVGMSAGELRENELAGLRAFTRSQVQQVAAWRAERLGDAQAQGNDSQLESAIRAWRRAASPVAHEAVVAQLRSASLATDYEDAALLDADGRVLASGAGRPLGESSRLATLVGRAIASGRIIDAGFEPVGEGGSMRLDVVVPLRGATATESFAVLLRADPKRSLLPALERLHRAVPTRVLLATRTVEAPGYQGVATSRAAGDDPLARRVMLWLGTLGPELAQADGPLLRSPVDGADAGRELTLAMPVPDTPWVVVADADETALQAATSRRSAWIALGDVLVLGIAAVLLFTIWQRRELRLARRERRQQADQLRGLNLLDAIANASTDAIYAKDTSGRYLFVNDALCQLIGRSREEALGHLAEEVSDPAEARRLWQLQESAMNAGQVQQSEGWVATPTGRRYFMSVMGPLKGAAGELLGMFTIARDVSARRREEDRLRQWSAAMAATREGVMITDRQNRIVAVNRAFTAITGWTEEDSIGQSPVMLRSGRHDRAFYRALWDALSGEGHWQGEIWNRRKCGEVFPEWLTISAVRDEAGEITHYVGVFSDISGLKRNEAQLERLAHYDALTELPNRRLLHQRVDQALAHARRLGTRVAVLTLDIDHFKNVNDSWDHAAGDELLVALSRRLRERLRAEDTLGRLGGDEFLVLVDDVSEAGGVVSLADDLLDALSLPVLLSNGREVRVTASMGIALFPDDGAEDAAQMLRNADAAMYRAKEAGRNQFSYYTADLNDLAVQRLEMETALGHAIERRELQLHYQPKVDAATGRIVSAEALLRWFRPGGVVSPGQFIPVVESGPLIFEIGGWVIERACAQLREWMDAGLPVVPIAVNVAARQFAAGDLDLVVARALQKHAVPPEMLEIELTESALLDHGSETMLLLHRLKALGVQLSLDDFGTGYSSLAYLRQFPIDEVKIDRAFVRDIGVGDDGAAICDMVLALGRRLRLRVVAEGVETEAQRHYLAQHGCDVLQGFLFARPAAAEALQALLAVPAAPAAATNVFPLRAS